MKYMLTVVLVATALATVMQAQGTAAPSLEGVWKVAEESYAGGGAEPSSTNRPQPGLLIFTKNHYSFIRVVGFEPRPLFKDIKPTDEEKILAFDAFTASSGTYELTGASLTMYPMVAKHPNFMAGGSEKYEFRLDGNTLWLMAKYTDINMRVADRIVPVAGPLDASSRRKLIRIE